MKIAVIVFTAWGTALSAGLGSDSFMGGKTAFMFFTIQSNLAPALISLVGCFFLFGKKQTPILKSFCHTF